MPTITSYQISLTGTPYDNGHAKGTFVREDEGLHRNLLDRLCWFDSYDQEQVDLHKLALCQEHAEQRLPSLWDEIRGFAYALRISYEHYLPYLLFDWEIPSHCSQFCVLGNITQDHKVYTGHSWEWTMVTPTEGRRQTLEEDNLYVIANHGAVRYMGFALNYFGLWNGMNGHGVSINPTGGVPLAATPPTRRLYNHGLLVRIILETCRSADEALQVVQEFIPLSSGGGGGTLIITDRAGTSYYIERAEQTYCCQRVGRDTGQPYQCAANHFSDARMFPYASQKGVHSIVRYNALNRQIEAHAQQITMDTLLEMQRRPLPDGPCCHYYSAYLGTVRSMVYDLTDLQAMVCYGSPRLNPWHAYGFDTSATKVRRIETEYVDEQADPAIWKQIPAQEDWIP